MALHVLEMVFYSSWAWEHDADILPVACGPPLIWVDNKLLSRGGRDMGTEMTLALGKVIMAG